MKIFKVKNMVMALLSLTIFQPCFSQDLLVKSFSQIQSLNNSKISDIEQSKDGFVWFIADAQVFRFDGFELTALNEIVASEILPIYQVIAIEFDSQNNLWISTQEQGLFIYNGQKISTPQWQESISFLPTKPVLQILFDREKTWLISTFDLVLLEEDNIERYPIPIQYQTRESNFKNAILSDNNEILIASKTQLLKFNTQSDEFSEIDFSIKDENPYIWNVQYDPNKQLWLATDAGAYQNTKNRWRKIKPEQLNVMIKSIAFTDNRVWFATALNGLAEYIPSSNHLIWHQSKDSPNSLLSNNLQQITTDNNNLIWLTYFQSNLSLFDPDQRSPLTRANCSKASAYYGFTENHKYRFFLTADAIVIENKLTGNCDKVLTMNKQAKNFKGFTATEIFIDSTQRIWIGSSRGLIELDAENNRLLGDDFLLSGNAIKTVSELDQDHLLIGSIEGLYIFAKANNSWAKYDVDNPLSSAMYLKHSQNQNQRYFITNKGLATFNQSHLELSENIMQMLGTRYLTSLTQNDETLFIGTQSKGVFAYNKIQQTGRYLNLDQGVSSSIVNLISDPVGDLIINHQNGIVSYHVANQTFTNLTEKLGLKNIKFIESSAFLADNRSFYLGTATGFVKLVPADLHIEEPSWPLYITRIKRFNETVLVNNSNEGFDLPYSVEKMDQIELTHKDYVIEFQFSYLDYLKPDSYEFAYQLVNFDPGWTEVSANKRFASYTNLPAGQYKFLLKIKQANGQWSEPLNSLVIRVKPAPWLSWWAFIIYAVLLLSLIIGYIRWKTLSNIKIAQRLRLEVKEKTKEINTQKQTVESLLAKKNELFSNVSHEFRTPLTLILGPIKELLFKYTSKQDVKSLSMINRNANRLLSLVEQLLQIARVSDVEKVKTKPQNTQKQVASLVESFEHMAQAKQIKMSIQSNEPATIDVTDQFIDAVLGNLVSNAIKYTQSGGSVWVDAKTNDNSFLLSVKDTGAGLTQEQQKYIFKRFKRLESHQAIEGIGIGLSVVEEVVKVNGGHIEVKSQLGTGSEFLVRVPLSDATEANEESNISSLVNQLQKESTEKIQTENHSIKESTVTDNTLNTVLVIEDNHDMRDHIISIINPHYNCLTAENGTIGVAKAIEEIPDIIISDVMMPEMDGFQVARIIRSDHRTSHIPLMLLTALNDKTSRIKGWREHVDAYMTKPFDRDELLIQLDNMLTIRDILKKKAGQELNSGKQSTDTLPKKDQEFVDKLIQVIENNYMNPLLNRSKMANILAVSDRQLQRKIKALIDQNPMDMLREYRLNRSKGLLKDGYQVSQISDDCGFNSISYFSQCFKARFGVSPKKYQQNPDNK